MAYAADTRVPVERSKAEIERLVVKNGAKSFLSGLNEREAMVAFELHDRRIKFILRKPVEEEKGRRSDEQQWRSRWRSLLLCIKAKLDAVETGIETVEEAFLPHIMTQNGHTVGEIFIPQMQSMIESGKLPPLLPGARRSK